MNGAGNVDKQQGREPREPQIPKELRAVVMRVEDETQRHAIALHLLKLSSFWVVSRAVLNRVGLLDERFERAYWEDDDLLARLRQAGIPTRQVASVRVAHIGGLTTVKIPEHRKWLEGNARRFEEKWGWLPPLKPRYRRASGESIWHFCQNCPNWPTVDFRRQLRPMSTA
jgi:GT2 family glycosyltransferase